MVGQIFLWLFIICAFAFLFKIVYSSDKHYNWFMKLKPGDKILVMIYSHFCECLKEAEVTKASNGKYLEAKILDIEFCKNCAEFNSKDKKGEQTCWYNVVMFKKSDVCKIKQ